MNREKKTAANSLARGFLNFNLLIPLINPIINSLSISTHPIEIHRAAFEKLRFVKKAKKKLILNISENGPIILPKELDRELSIIYHYKEF